MQVSFKPLHPEAIELRDVAERRVNQTWVSVQR